MRTKEEIKEYQKNYRLINKDALRLKRKEWEAKNSEKLREYSREYNRKWREENRQRSRDTVKRSYYKNHTQRLADRRKSYRENKEKENKYRVELTMRKYYEDPITWLVVNHRTRLNQALNRGVKKFRKLSKSLELFGADIDQIKKHIESKFTDGMNWSNRGRWHVDHIIPISSFDLSSLEEQKKAFHYTNLQPLWAVDNLKKGNKIK